MKTTRIQDLIAAVFVSVLALIPTTLLAQDAAATGDKTPETQPPKEVQNPPGPAEDQWHLSIVPLAWAAGINGNVTARGRTANVNLDFDQLFNHTDAGFMTYVEVGKDKFGFYGQPSYMKLSADGNAGPLQGSDTLQLWIVEVGAYYQLLKLGEDKPLTIRALAGMRYWDVHNEISLNGTRLGLVNFNSSSTLDLYDPLIGLGAQKYLIEKLSVVVRGDIGGFGASNSSSDFSWQAIALLGYDFTKHFSLYAGYRALGIKKENGSGDSKNGADLTLNGALLGFNFTF